MKKNILKEQKRKQNNKGFTFVELIVVITLLLILAGGLVFGISKWVEWTQFKQQNEYARVLFTAAQNQLSEYSSSGQLEELQTNVEKSRTINSFLSTLKDSEGKKYDLNTVFPQSVSKSEPGRYQDEIYSIIGTADDYKAYQKGEASEELTAMYDMFVQYLYDTSILNATICVEFTADDGQVFAVLYSNKNSGFEYNSSNTNRRGIVDISDRQASYRKPRMTGYYGVDELYKATSSKTEKPVLSSVKLNNEDTLNLSFALSKVKSAAQNMTYEIDIYDKTSKNLELMITLDGTKIKNEQSRQAIPCEVTRYEYGSDGKKTGTTKMGTYHVLAWIDGTETIRVILDAADLDATSSLYYSIYKTLMKASTGSDNTLAGANISEMATFRNSYSFRRFGVNVEDIYCTIQGSGKDYKTTAKRQSNSENAYMGSFQAGTEKGKTTAIYTIKNARHLYNMRYLEDYTDAQRTEKEYEDLKTADSVTYQLASDVNWVSFTESALYRGGEKTQEQEFPSLKQLRKGMKLESVSTKTYKITNLRITEKANAASYVYGVDEKKVKIETGPTGLFVTNSGIIQKLIFDQVSISGTDSVGTVCGQNAGTLKNLEIANSNNESSVKGASYVGGITGRQSESEKSALYSTLTNRASVTGTKNVGGIIGYASSKEATEDIKIEYCNNYGRMSLSESVEADNPDAGYMGGIAGYLESVGNYKLSLSDCKSSPQYTEDEFKTILSSKDELSKKLKGTYVGGIVGYVDGAVVTNCNTRKEKSSANGYVFGYRYVGGIVGGSTNANLKLKGGENNVNEAFVLAYEYAGGIIGESDTTTTVSNWQNRGVVAAESKYAGGIAGTNRGRLLNCSSDVDNTSQARMIRDCAFLKGDYAGGIAGYNNGSMTNDASTPIVAYVTGHNFVGGIVGYNDVEAVVENYRVDGGYVNGSGSYVGGYAGCNRSIQLLEDSSIVSNPNEVNGAYCVGGIIGGNIIPTAEDFTTYFTADNFLGTLNATAIAGGFIGYNQVITETNTADVLAGIEANAAALNGCQSISEIPNAISSINLTSGTGTVMWIDGQEENVAQSRFEGITAGIYVAGVIGYNQEETGLYIKNVINNTPITATSAITNEEEQNRNDYNGEAFQYSYAGGIVGKVTPKITLDNCMNQGNGDVVTQGTYLGSLCEINEGTIQNCRVSSIGTSSRDYVGGITGLNKADATIATTSFSDRTITGRKYVGGIAAENFGTIESTQTFENSVVSGGSETGGITGYNGGTVVLSGTNAIRVSASGDNIGGAIGVNAGSLSVSGESDKAVITGNISGNQNVGGFIGLNQGGDVSRLQNETAVTSANGAVGGIIGADNSSPAAKISDCDNYGIVTATQSGNAGGILGENQGTIENCSDYAQVNAPNGISGGIAGVNYKDGLIASCSVKPTLALSFTGKEYVGGISGTNDGTIASSSVQNISIVNLASSRNSALGGITGTNSGTITACNVGTEQSNLILKSNAATASVGGVAGRNTGTIQGTSGDYAKVYASISFALTDMAYYGYLGGIAGTNDDGMIQYYEFNGEVEGTANNPQNSPEYNPNTNFETNGSTIYGYGGIAGVNGDSGEESSGTISDCKVNVAKITGLGDANNIANIGGVAGVNGLGSTISNITFGTEEKYKISNSSSNTTAQNARAAVYVGTDSNTSAYGHTGGVAGLNSGTITSIGTTGTSTSETGESSPTYSAEVDKMRVIIENNRGHVGGIIGYNRQTGSITEAATGNKWLVYAPNNAQDNGCGGLVGYQASENGASYCFNRATVVKLASGSNAVGGLIGRMEVSGDGNWLIAQCANYGSVYGSARVGGMVGVWKYYGGTVIGYKNFGEISEVGSEGAGGIVGMLYGVSETPANIVNCENHGTINSGIAGGIMGQDASNSNDVYLIIQNCVNTGLIKAGNKSAGILGALNRKSVSGSKIVACNNYGYGIGSTELCGIVSASAKNITVEKCFGLADTKYPITTSAHSSGGTNYYLINKESRVVTKRFTDAGESTEGEPDSFYVREMTMSGRDVINPTNLYYSLRSSDTDETKDGTNTWGRNSTNPGTYTYTYVFNRNIDLDKIELMWAWDGGRELTYSIDYSSYTDPTSEHVDWKTIAFREDSETDTTTVDGKKVIQIGCGTGVKAHMIRIEVTNCVNTSNANANIALRRMWLNGNITVGDQTYSYDGKTGMYAQFNAGVNRQDTGYEDAGALQRASVSNTSKYTGLAYEEVTYAAATEQTDKGKGTGVNVDDYDEVPGTFKLNMGEKENPIIVGLPGFPIDPLSYMGTSETSVKTDTSLKAMGDTSDNLRYRTFLADNAYFTTDAELNVVELDKPIVNEPEDVKNASYKFSWNEVPKAIYYDYEAQYLDADGKVIATRKYTVYGTDVTLSVLSINGTDVAKVVFKVRAGTDTNGSDGNVHKVWSAYSDEKSLDLTTKPILPTPLYHAELIEDNSTLKYQVILDNQEEYKAFIEEHNLQMALKDITIEVLVGSTNISFTVQDGVSKRYFNGNGKSNIMFYAGASVKNNLCTSSARPARESQAPKNEDYQTNTEMETVKMTPDKENVGFRGSTEDTLSYQMTVQYARFILYMRSEFVATDTQLGVPVVLSTSQVRASDTTAGAIPVSLSSLPANILSGTYTNLMLRSYPVMMSNNIVYMGHTVNINGLVQPGAIGLTKEQLKKLYVTDDHQVSSSGTDKLIEKGADGKAKLADGYVIELAADGTYTLYYNTLLKFNSGYEYPSGNTMKNQVFYYWLTEKDIPKKQPTPIIHYNDTQLDGNDGDANADTLVITWDQNNSHYKAEGATSTNYKIGAIYDYVVTGKTADGTSVQLDAGTYTTSADAQNKLTYDTREWNYTTIVVSITRRGEENSNGFTTVLPVGEEKTITMKLHFSQITRPDVSLHKEEGIVQKNTLVYDAVWGNIPVEERSVEEVTQLSGYEVGVRRSANDTGARQTFKDSQSYAEARDKANTLYSGKENVTKTEGTNQTTYVWAESGSGYTVTKTMVLSYQEDAQNNSYTLEKSLTESWVFAAAPEDITTNTSISRILDLNDYERGEDIDISVRALANKSEDKEQDKSYIYRDSITGVVRELTLPSRLDVPNVAELVSVPEYAEDKSVTTQEYAQGLEFSFKPETESGVLQGKYEIAAAVYDSKEDDTKDKIANSGDAVDESGETGYWNSGAVETLLSKSTETAMNGNLIQATYNLALTNQDYAGKWLKIAMRSISESKVSSTWSDEDDTTEATVNYKWIQIPRIQVDTPQITTGSKTLYYLDGKWKGNPNLDGPETVDDLGVTQTSLSFDMVAHADQYQMELIRSTKADAEMNTEKNFVVQYADWIYMEKTLDGGYDIFYTSSDPGFDPTPYWADKAIHPEYPDCAQNANAVYLGKIQNENDFIQLPYQEEARETALDSSPKVNVVSYIQRSAAGFRLVLPDAEVVGEYVDSNFLFTSQMAVRANIADANLPRYAASEINNWYRNSEGTTNTQIISDFETAEELNGLTYAIDPSEKKETAYEISTTSSYRLVYDIKVIDEYGNVVSDRYISSYGSGDTSVENIALLPDDIYAQYQGKTMQIRAAAIIKVTTDADGTTHGALSKWSEWITFDDPLPELSISQPTISEQASSLSGTDAEGTTKVVAATTFTWSQQIKAASYILLIGNDSYDTANYVEGVVPKLNSMTINTTITVTPTLEITKAGDTATYSLTVPDGAENVKVQAVPRNANYTAEEAVIMEQQRYSNGDAENSNAGNSSAGNSSAENGDAENSSAENGDAENSDAENSNAVKSNAEKSNAENGDAENGNAEKSNAENSNTIKTK
ncbi:MAG: prepilin-type N-terminal cleavage/methylation domain-containing protein [Hespellia sp.]|nr:prepilin-type N-terminal cleavage/methylation domain-containing protein [Hespellia sp.]